ncbi:double-strand break repair protein AddB [Sphingomonas oleivorans]|uniref:Double-strand break repair protein AddB n=1 Tax=Sphingomonas oleivorans TaxID=1735121 RepID=A0A2T5FTM1_9SPHN|nr:double-strand break repair protein AddB [Sphingomonas oleivorans]PTQ07403.1 double-strand break repair protein AddB [Sphingomonas oleivorans]
MQPAVFTIPPHRAFADALAAGLIDIYGQDRLALARGTILIPNNRAARAISDAFVRRSGQGLLLPRLVAIGDPELDDRLGAALDPLAADGEEDIPPAIEPVARQLLLARLVEQAREEAGDPVDAAEAIRLAADLARTLDQLLVEGIEPRRLADAVPAELSHHWEASLRILATILDRWPAELARLGRIDLADRRNRLLARTERRWAASPPPGFVVAAGITVAAPVVAALLARIARLDAGMVVLPGLDLDMPGEEWDALGPNDGARPIETHPQYHLKLLLDRMGVGRAEVRVWRRGGGSDAPAVRTRAIGNAMAPAAFTGKWQDLEPAERRLSGVRALELAAPAEEAQAIAIAMREVLETPGRTAALVTPDRALAGRVVAHLARWGVEADDSAGRPLSAMPPGTLLLAIAEAAAEGFAPVPLLALLKHPLVRAGEGRLAWLDGARRLDCALRGPRPDAGLDGVTRHLLGGEGRQQRDRLAALDWWKEVAELLRPLEQAFSSGRSDRDLATLLAAVRDAATALAGDEAWSRPAGRAAAELVAQLEAAAPGGPRRTRTDNFPLLLKSMLDEIAIRPPQGGHARIFIWGLIEARLQHADLMILGGLNEGVWPSAPAPDPWLAPAIRSALGLPGLERRIGIQAHEFAGALGAPQVLVTRARRDARAPAIASRFWLRLEAMTGGLARMTQLRHWAHCLDRPADYAPASRPQPSPPVADRPRRIAVTKLDRLKADPFAFYADAMLGLRRWDAVDADPTAAWRGTAVHAVFERWMKEDDCDPAKLRSRAEAMLEEIAAHPVLRALWTPRLIEAIDWVAAEMSANLSAGRKPLAAERKGKAEVAGITLEGTVDRIDRLPDGSLAIVDYKTGQPPATRAVAAGYAMQLGLLGLIAEHGGFGEDVKGIPQGFEYWSLASAPRGDGLGYVASPVGLKKNGDGIDPADFTSRSAAVLTAAVAQWLAGDAPFTAKLHPEYAPYADYDQLMRLDEWYGRADE